MKKILFVLLALMLASVPALGEEFFAEEPAEASAGVQTEDFFAEDTAAGESAAQAAEDRSVVAVPTEEAGTEADWQAAPELKAEAGSKANRVKLSWTHDADGCAVRLPKYVSYYVYETDPKTGASYQRAKTAKKSVTLKNVTAGSHTYFVRAEFSRQGEEIYGASSGEAEATVTESTMWKKITKVEYVQEYSDTAKAEIPVLYFTTDEPAEFYRIKFSWKEPGKKYWTDYEVKDLKTDDALVMQQSGYSYRFWFYCVTPFERRNGSSYRYTVTPCKKVNGKTVKGSSKTIGLPVKYQKNSDWKAAPRVTGVTLCGDNVGITFEHLVSVPADHYKIYDGSKAIATVAAADLNKGEDGSFTAAVLRTKLSGGGKAGKHKLSVRPVLNGDLGKKSAQKTLVIPKAKSAPVTGTFSVSGDGTVQVDFYDNNPNAASYEVHIFKKDGSGVELSAPVDAKSSSETTAAGLRAYRYVSTEKVASEEECCVIVKTKLKTGALLVSDLWTEDGVMRLAR